jgi:hypothetical protein
MRTLTLTQYIEKYGDEICAERFNTKPRTVASWRRKERFPRQRVAFSIIEAAKGELTMDGIYGQMKDA